MTSTEALATITVDVTRTDLDTETLIHRAIAHGVGPDEVALALELSEHEFVAKHGVCVRHA